jgi:hypothetical protein
MSTFAIRDGVPYMGEKAYPWAAWVRSEEHDSGAGPWYHRGFHLTFENGWTLSVSWGTGTYCENRDVPLFQPVRDFIEEPATAECWGWYGDGETAWEIEDGSPLGWQSVKDVQVLMLEMQHWASLEVV